MKLSSFSIRRPVFTLVSMFLVLILGGVSLLNIPQKLIPDINPPIGVVVVSYPGASPVEVVESVSKPMEVALSTLPGLNSITSTSSEGASLTLLQFSWTTKIEDVQSEIESSMNQARLPDDAQNPRFLKFDPSQFPIIQLSLTSPDSEETLQELAENLKLELTKVDGVASVNLSGVTTDEVKIQLDQEKLQTYRLSQSTVVDMIRANNISLPGDTILTNGRQLTTRVISSINSLHTLRNLALTIDPATGEKITLDDVSSVKIAPQNEDTITRANREPAILISVLQQSDANTATVSTSFQEKLNELLKEEKYEEIESKLLFDQGEYIQDAIGNMSNSLILGGLFAMIVLFFFLRSVKSPLIIGIAIPYSVIVTFVLMYFADFTLNIMTLGGLALGIGMLVDNAIVVIENINRHLAMGKTPKEAAADGAQEVGTAIIASTLTTVAVFLPVVFISGIIGELFTEFAVTIAFSLFASLFVALTVVPMLAAYLLKSPTNNIEETRQNSASMRFLENSIRWALKRRAVVLLITFILLTAGAYGVTTVGTEFLPNSDEGYFSLNVRLENGAALSETEKVVSAIEDLFEEEEEVDVVVSLIGTTQENAFRGTTKANIAEIYVNLVELRDRDRSVFEIVDDVKKDVEKAAEKANKTAEVSFSLQSTTGSSPNTMSFTVKDTNNVRLTDTVVRIQNALEEIDNVTELTNDKTETVEEIQITIDRDKAFAEGLMPAQIAMILNDVTRGVTALQMTTEAEEIYNVHVSYDPSVTKDIDKIKGILIRKNDGTYIPLEDLTIIQVGEGPTSVKRVDQQSAIDFTLKYTNDTNLGDISKLVDEKIADLDLPEETEITFGGDRELLESSINSLALAFVLAIVFIYLVMAAQFESFKYPFVIMLTVPLMVIGVAIALTVTQTPLGLTAIIGLIVLAGIVVNNAIVLVDYVNQKKTEGMKTYDALVASVKDRARPILMTAFTTILGLLPLALALGEGTEVNQPMGVTVIGGLISSTFLTLFVIPVVYSFFDKQTRNLNKKYVTPDGQLIPAYLLEDRIIQDEHETEEVKEGMPNLPSKRSYNRQDMKFMLEELLKIVDEKDQGKQDEGDKDNKR